MIKDALWKAFLATFLFIAVYFFYNNEMVRANTEDIAFDIINKFSIHRSSLDTNSSQVLLFAIDDLYMREHQLYDEENESSYGYLFPRDHLASFIENLDELVSEMEPVNFPKALFIDYDMSFTLMPYGKVLSKEDRMFLEVLKNSRPYVILLPKTEKYNFIQTSSDPEIRRAILEKKIILVSVPLLSSSDGIVRRYQSYQAFQEGNGTKKYIGVAPALWQLMRDNTVDINRSLKQFTKNDIVGNRIWIKSYRTRQAEEGCVVEKSYWDKLTKYSANCSLFEIIEEDFAGSIVMLGATHTQNDDRFDVLNVAGARSVAGIDMQANALMTMLQLDGPLKRLPLWISIVVIFFAFLLIDIALEMLFSLLKIKNDKIQFMILLVINTTVLVAISVYLLKHHHLWFNWFVPLLLLQMIEIIEMIQKQIPKLANKLRRRR